MALTDKLRDLDQRLLPGTRDDGEDAETYLRRVATSRAITPAQAGDVMAALRVYFGVEPGAETGDGDGEDGSEESKDESEEPKDESEEGAQDGEKSDEESEEESDEESDDDS